MPLKKTSLGILSTLRPNPELPFGGQTEPFGEIIDFTRRRGCRTFVFTPEDLDWTNNTVWGYLPINNQWERRIFKLPAVIYNRLPNRSIEQREEYREALEKLSLMYKGRFFNPFFLNKWSVYNILAQSEVTKALVPQTHELSLSKLINMSERFGTLYLKPQENSLGFGIYKWTLHRELELYSCIGIDNSIRFVSKKGLKSEWTNLPFYDKPYLIQQKINLAKFEGRAFDLRVLYQKDKQGQWQKTGYAARISGIGSITTHVLYGGNRAAATKLLKMSFGKEGARKIHRKITRLAALVPPLIEKTYGRKFGELEIDIGIDEKGKMWIFEINSKPFKFDEPLIRAKSLIRLTDYVKNLARSR